MAGASAAPCRDLGGDMRHNFRVMSPGGKHGISERGHYPTMRASFSIASRRIVGGGSETSSLTKASSGDMNPIRWIMQHVRALFGRPALEALIGDLRFAGRSYARKPLITATIVTVLALGIGANAGIFSVIQAFTQRPAPGVPRDESLVRVYGLHRPNRTAALGLRGHSLAELAALQARRETFAAVAGWLDDDVVIERQDRSATRGVTAQFVTADFWRTLGIQPANAPTHERIKPTAAILSHWLAAEWFDSPSAAIGARVLVNGSVVRIAGIAPRHFQGAVRQGEEIGLWLPIEARAQLADVTPRSEADSARVSVFARLRDGATHAQASALAQQLAVTLNSTTNTNGAVFGAAVTPIWAPPPAIGPENIVGFVAMGIIAVLILLVACTNVSSLLVALAVGRRHEIAVRLSLGASRARLIRQLLTESATLSVAGGVAGLLVYWGLTTWLAARANDLRVDIAPDYRTIAFTVALAIVTGLLFGLSPALHATRAGVATALRESGAGATGRSRLQRLFVGAQIVFSQPLLVLLAMMLAIVIPTGPSMSDPVQASTVLVRFRPVRNFDDVPARRAELQRVMTALAAEPEVAGVVPEPAGFAFASLDVQSQPSGSKPITRVHMEGATPGYFSLVSVPLVLGRDVALEDTASSEVRVVVPSDMVRTLWGSENPLGKLLPVRAWSFSDAEPVRMVVVGVYDGAHATTRGAGRVYTAWRSRWRSDAMIVRTHGSAAPHVIALRDRLRSAAPGLPVEGMQTLAESGAKSKREELQVAAAATAGGALALLLASLGLFAVVSLAVGQRRREIGIRIALGGTPRRVAAMFFGSGVRLCAIAMLVGLPVSAIAARVAISQGVILVPDLNLTSIALAISLVVLVVASMASWLPARRAALVDPSLALKAE